MEIIWNQRKAAGNPRNHEGVTFEEAREVLLDPYTLVKEDEYAEGENGFLALGMGPKGRILLVVYTYGKEKAGKEYVRIISAWKANEKQRRQYEKQFR